jgi:hypothetical protein
MISNPDMVLSTIPGTEIEKPDWHKVFLFVGKIPGITQHTCLYEGKVAYEKLKDHLILSQITVKGNTIIGIETTPYSKEISQLVPKETLLRDSKVWRFMSLYKFEDIINLKSLYFARLDQFKDNLEGISPNRCMEAILSSIHLNEMQKTESLRLFNLRMENNRRVSYACCWHINKNLNLKLWDQYGECSTESICIQTTAPKLEKELIQSGLPVLCEPIQYLHEQYFNQNAYWFPTLFKRIKYSPEQEYRSIFFVHGLDSNFLRIRINPEKLINKIYVHPKASKEFFKKIRLTLKKYGLKIPVAHAGRV